MRVSLFPRDTFKFRYDDDFSDRPADLLTDCCADSRRNASDAAGEYEPAYGGLLAIALQPDESRSMPSEMPTVEMVLAAYQDCYSQSMCETWTEEVEFECSNAGSHSCHLPVVTIVEASGTIDTTGQTFRGNTFALVRSVVGTEAKCNGRRIATFSLDS